MGILVVILFVLQLLSFYFIVILYMKLSKFQDLERKQVQLIREMDDMVGAYLLEMREENDRLIEELSKTSPPVGKEEIHASSNETMSSIQQVKENNTFELDVKSLVPKAVMAKAYTKQQTFTNTNKDASLSTESTNMEHQEMSLEKQVLQLAQQGQTAEEIAKVLQKGKTEIELLLKFHA